MTQAEDIAEILKIMKWFLKEAMTKKEGHKYDSSKLSEVTKK